MPEKPSKGVEVERDSEAAEPAEPAEPEKVQERGGIGGSPGDQKSLCLLCEM